MFRRIALVTDFGSEGPYLGQLRLVLQERAPMIPVINLVADLPPFRPDLAAYLLPRLLRGMPDGTLYVCVVDPGVGSDRLPVILHADGNAFVGPDNGLLSRVAQTAEITEWRRIDWRPSRLSSSFHGRDLFAPVAAELALGKEVLSSPLSAERLVGVGWPEQCDRVIYRDVYGNLVTGMDAENVDSSKTIELRGKAIGYARTFSEVPVDEAFWYENAFGLVELAVNQGRADEVLGVNPGDEIRIVG